MRGQLATFLGINADRGKAPSTRRGVCMQCTIKAADHAHFIFRQFSNLMKVGLVQRQLHLQLVAGGFSTCLQWPR